MKRILITGKGSYIGSNFKKYMDMYPDRYYVEELDMMGDSWKQYDFSSFDVVYHVAGLAHSTPDESQRKLYYKVNTDLVYEVAKKAKDEGVKQFIFMSSLIVYGSGEVGKDRVISKDTLLTPDNFYGDSKKQAEIKIQPLQDDNFKIVVLRPPMIYGPNAKGNYPRLVSLAKKTPIFPNIKNERSMLFLGNLLSFVRLMIDNEEQGTFLPQNEEYVCTSELVRYVAKMNHHRVWFTKLGNPLIRLLGKKSAINKLFGNLVIDKELSRYKEKYCTYGFEETIEISEGRV